MRPALAAAALLAALLGTAGAPPGMVRVPAGQFYRGCDDGGRPDEHPRHLVRVSGFFLDATLVTREAFARFVAETGYRTTAERRGYGKVAAEGMADWDWDAVPGASWREPFGPDAGYAPRPDEPVTVVSWEDADAYCRHQGGRLPTEAEWEYAMRAGRSDSRYPWGDSPWFPDGGAGLNYWQGHSHAHNERRDGYLYLSPVRAFPPNAWGLYDPAGNVWQLVADWYDPEAYPQAAALDGGALDPRGPDGGTLRVARGGSWWCSARTCSGYGLFYRGKSVPWAAFNNTGFRCARDLPPGER